MSDNARRLTPDEATQTTANLGLAAQFVRELIERPEDHEVLPEDALLVLLPGDDPGDPELSRANIQMADRFAAEGRHVVTWVVGMPALSGPQALPRWPRTLGEGSGITYDRPKDLLTVVLSRPEGPTTPVRVHPNATVLMDPDTRLVRVLTIPHFLAEAAPKSLALLDLLLRPDTTLVGISRDELRSLRNTFAQGTMGDLLKELTRLIA